MSLKVFNVDEFFLDWELKINLSIEIFTGSESLFFNQAFSYSSILKWLEILFKFFP